MPKQRQTPTPSAHALLLMAVLAYLAAPPCQAAPYLSEVYLGGSLGSDTYGPAVEISGIFGETTLNLVVVDARPTSALITSVHTLNTAGLGPTLLFTSDTWPTHLWNVGPPSPTRITLAQPLVFNTWTELLLIVGPTDLKPNGDLKNPNDNPTVTAWDNSAVVDGLTWGRFGAASSVLGTPSLDAADGHIIVRPTVQSVIQYDAPLIGTADAAGNFTAGSLQYVVTPGLTNPSVTSLIPEPGAVGIALVSVCAMMLRRTKRRDSSRYSR